ncbi:hypothetical protein Poli38472_004167 [Pythium oligandrum]|uniref:Protein ENHANCED DISEASE RESISTANCE 2 C-terminal domain-containing protein n=1 Tax=Pythium oligandrum TaxID=41045 RepID=A0A8K1CPS3_PYTOL|nr:hypothetical protein Poli38472_004167 [Pythium oligandrum]|eukprot:TMW66402.1 hypothetical protein Poli38472_004167 [Pythium oligandrum]
MRSGQEAMKLEVQTMSPAPGRGVKKDAESPQTSPIPNKSWRQQAASCMEQHPALRKMWAEPDWASFKIRSKNYLHDKIKINTEEPLFELVWFDLFSGEEKDLLHICQNKKSFAQKAIAKYGSHVPQLFVVTLLVPGSPVVALVQYFALKPEMAKSSCEANQLWKNFLEGDDGFRKSRLKLIPSIPEGPWVIKKSVGNKPVILGHAIQLHFYRTDNYLEVSARQAKRLGKLASKPAVDDVVESEEEEELEEKRPANVGFAFLVDSDSDSDEDSDKEESDEEEVNASDDDEEEEQEEVKKPVAPVASNKSRKKAKKRDKKQGKDGDDVLPDGDDDELLDALAAQAGNLNVDQATSARNQTENSLFSVHLGVINADKEMARIFGVREVRENSGGRRVDPRNAARKTTKKVFMVTPHDEWPRPPTFVGGGIRWTRANKPAGPSWNSLGQYFEITWSMAYKKAQEEFEVLQQTHDPNLIAHFLRRYPFHIDALLQMSEVFQHHGQMDHASDCIKRCMYVMELAWADQFDVTKGNCRMNIHTEHNDGFFKALFLLMKQVGRRGCMRSAFETAKLLLGLDPQGDPMNVLLAIDYYAVSARQYQFILDLVASQTEAVDRFSKDEASKKPTSKKTSMSVDEGIAALPNLQFSLALSHHFLNNDQEAKEALARALLRFPTVLKPLLDKIAVNSSSGTWQSVLGSRIFANARSLDENGALQHVLDIYVQRNFSIWKVNEVQSFLLRGAQHAIASPTFSSAYQQVLELPPSLLKYKRSYPGDYSDEITTLPPDHPMLRPPELPNLNDLNEEQLAQLAELQAQAEAGNLPADANPLLLFLQTLLPWNRVQGANPPAPE